MQEEIENKTLSLTISAAKFSGRVLKAAIAKYLAHHKEKKLEKSRAPDASYGRVSMKKLQAQYGDLRSIEIEDKDTRQFERIARKYRVKYKVMKLEKGKYQVFFKAPNEEAMQSAFRKFAAKKIRQASRPSVLEKLQKLKALVKAPVLHKERQREEAR